MNVDTIRVMACAEKLECITGLFVLWKGQSIGIQGDAK